MFPDKPADKIKKMRDIVLLIVISGFFILLALLRPFSKGLRRLPGLIVLPYLSLFVIAGLFAVYGFRLECIPLFLYAIVFALFHIPELVNLIGRLHAHDFQDRNPALSLSAVAILVLVSGFAVFFAPRGEKATADVRVFSVDGDEKTARFLWFYEPAPLAGVPLAGVPLPGVPAADGRETGGSAAKAQAPLALVIPPLNGSLAAAGTLCRSLRERGFAVLAYSRRLRDNPAPGENGRLYPASWPRTWRLLWAALRGRDSGKANLWARAFEEERKEDIEWLLSYLAGQKIAMQKNAGQNPLDGADLDTIIVAAYGAAGAAISLLAAEEEFAEAHPGVKGFVSIEGPPASLLELESFPSGPSPEDGLASGGRPWYTALRERLKKNVLKLRPRKITGEIRPGKLRIPGLFLVSGKAAAAETRWRKSRYGGILAAVNSARVPAFMASFAGAGFMDYSDAPEKYPLYSFLLSGRRRSEGSFVDSAAALISNFAAFVLTASSSGGPEPGPETPRGALPSESRLPRTGPIKGEVQLESGGAGGLSAILQNGDV